MKIAQIAPLYESVPPKYYGGTERIVSYLTEELVRLGHEVTLFASGDSDTDAALYPQVPRSLRLDPQVLDPIAHHVLMAERIYQKAQSFDIIHNHIDYFPYSMIRRIDTPVLTTLHGRLDLPDLVPIYQEFHEIPVASISNSQRQPFPSINWQGTIYHGLPKDLYEFHSGPGSYLAFVGRICQDKGIIEAIETAIESGVPLKIAAKVDKVDEEYFKTEVEPRLHHPLIEYIGEINDAEKNEFIGNAQALLFLIDWPEPFGLVMLEAMACGTPVIARPWGSVPEILDHGVSGYRVENVDQAVEAVLHLDLLDRKTCRQVFETRFTATRMAEDYVRLYEQLIMSKRRDLKMTA